TGTNEDFRSAELVRAGPEMVRPVRRVQRPAVGQGHDPGELAVVVAGPDPQTQAELLEVADALGAPCLFFRPGQRGQKDPGQDGDDGDDDEQFNQGEGPGLTRHRQYYHGIEFIRLGARHNAIVTEMSKESTLSWLAWLAASLSPSQGSRTRRSESRSNQASPPLARSSQMRVTASTGSVTSNSTTSFCQAWSPLSHRESVPRPPVTRSPAPRCLPNFKGATRLVRARPSKR